MRAQDRIQTTFGGPNTAHTNSLTELVHIGDAIAGKGVNDQTTIIQRRDLKRVNVTRQDTVVIAHDLLDQRDFKRQTRLFLDVDHTAKLKHQCLFTFVDDKDRAKNPDHKDHDGGQQNGRFPHHWLPPLRSSFKGR